MEKILVTGGCGFIGSHITEQLVELGYHVLVVDNLATGSLKNIDQNKLVFFKCDILDNQFSDIFNQFKPNYVIHQAAQANVTKSINNFLYDESINIQGTLRVIELSRKYNVKKIIFASTSAVYGDPIYLPMDTSHPNKPLSPYGASKYAAELYLELAKNLFEIDYTVLRYGNVYGPRQNPALEGGVVAIFSNLISQGIRPQIYGDGEQTRDFIYVGDVVSANINALKHGSGEVLNVSSGNQISINELFKLIKLISNSNIEPVYLHARPGDIKHSLLCIKKTLNLLKWEPKTSIEDGLFKTLSFYA